MSAGVSQEPSTWPLMAGLRVVNVARAHGAAFPEEALQFLAELRMHNDREWFAQNKARFEADVQAPAVAFIAQAGAKLRKLSPHVVADAKPFGGSLSRIYRDTRFSKDKSPYHTHLGIHFSHDAMGSNDAHLPGFFLHLEPGESAAYSGVWRPEPAALKAIRDAIVAKPAEWKKVTKKPVEPYGEALKRPPPGYDPSHPLIEDLKRKDFVGMISLTSKQLEGPNFTDAFVGACRAMDPLNSFLAKAMGVPW